MIVTRLRLEDLRAIEAAELRFAPGMNLIVGVNGVGKTSILDALGVCLSAIVKRTSRLQQSTTPLFAKDVRACRDALTIECEVRLADRYVTYRVRRSSSSGTSSKADLVGRMPEPDESSENGVPLAIMFSTNRATTKADVPHKAAVGEAFASALSGRVFRLGEMAAWLRAQEVLRDERSRSARVLATLESAIQRFLPGYRNLRPEGEGRRPQLWIDRESMSIPVQQLSDGERGNLALVLDVSRRLALANPNLADPAAEAEAVVLIDELDLHLHPKWQRRIVHNLAAAFPRCQFIATTHSPQVIGEVPHDHIQIIADGEVYSPPHSFGVDSSRVLEEVMEADPRTKKVHELLGEISRTIGRERFEQGRELLEELVAILGESDPEVTRVRTLLDFLEGEE
ncbi:MAG: AAA family ATPase [Gammaproteobacteria bacterium]|nr:AAA family ATPase [Gammaproteobacteria bacterium]